MIIITGRTALLTAALVDAIHDSAAREIILEGIPKAIDVEFVNTFSSWVHERHPGPPLAFVTGPRSDLAQLCAERLEAHLAASYFLSNPQYDDPTRFFPTIAYQLVMNCPIYAEILEDALRKNPAALTKSLKVQFRELIFIPVMEALAVNAGSMTRKVIIVDGLEGYERRVRAEIIRTVAKATEEGLPLHWAFFSYQEDMDDEFWSGSLGSSGGEFFWRVHVNLRRDLSEIHGSTAAPGRVMDGRSVQGAWKVWVRRAKGLVVRLCAILYNSCSTYVFVVEALYPLPLLPELPCPLLELSYYEPI